MKRVIRLVGCVVAAVVVGFLVGCTIQPGREAPPPTPVPLPKAPDKPVFKVLLGTVVDSNKVLGRVVPARQVELFFKKPGQVVVVNANYGDMVKKGQVIAQIETGSLGEQLAKGRYNLDLAQLRLDKAEASARQARRDKELALERAKTNLEVAQLRLKEKEEQAASPATSSEAQVARAEANLKAAKLRLAQAQEAARLAATRYQDDLLIAKTNLDKAAVDLEMAQAAYDRVGWRSDVGRTTEARNLQTATLAYQLALATYERLKKGPAPDYSVELALPAVKQAELDLEQAQSKVGNPNYEVEVLRKNVALARLEVEKLQQELKDDKNYDLEVLRLDRDKAQAELQQLEADMKAAQLIAPFDGEVRELKLSVGKQMRAYETVAILGEKGEIEVTAEVSRADLSYLSVGTPVTITESGMIAKDYKGHLARLPGVTLEQGIERPDPYTHFQIDTDKAGLEVDDAVMIQMVLRQRPDVLIVPGEAIRSIRGKNYVELWQDGRTKLVEVEIGLFTAEAVEVKSGLEEGQEVLGR